MKLNFQILTTLLSFCTTGKTVTEMKNKLIFDHDAELVQKIIDYMITAKLIVKTQTRVNGGNKQPTTWVKNISLKNYAIKKAA